MHKINSDNKNCTRSRSGDSENGKIIRRERQTDSQTNKQTNKLDHKMATNNFNYKNKEYSTSHWQRSFFWITSAIIISISSSPNSLIYFFTLFFTSFVCLAAAFTFFASTFTLSTRFPSFLPIFVLMKREICPTQVSL